MSIATTSPRKPLGELLFLITTFLGAFLLFQVQPLVSKRILPWFGGTPTVWNTCLLFFQLSLLAGYCFAHLSGRLLSPKWQSAVFVSLLIGAVALPILPGAEWTPKGASQPTPLIIQMLLFSVGPPFFVLAASGPLIQSWFVRVFSGRSPYYLYAVGNAGSLLALLSYPVVFEPLFAVSTLARMWRWLFVAFLVLASLLAWLARGTSATVPSSDGEDGSTNEQRTRRKGWFSSFLWIAWPACGVILFMSVTNQLTLNLAAVPFLWVMPLAIYLVSFIVAFSGSAWYPRDVFGTALWVSLIGFYLLLPGEISPNNSLVELGSITKLAAVAVGLFVCCMVCHGEVYRLKPDPRHLTRYYLAISLGGAIGGILVAVVAPAVFLLFHELQFGLLLCGCLFLFTHCVEPHSESRRAGLTWARAGMVATLVVMAGVSWWLTNVQLQQTVLTKRNFFGLIRVKEIGVGSGVTPYRMLLHGSTIHGIQYTGATRRRYPTGYYGPITGIASVLDLHPTVGRRIGVVGMGSATLVAHAREGDYFKYYEIDPDMVEVAKSQFTFLSDTRGKWDVVLGDARLRLEEEDDNRFDVLVLDAFSSDAIPVHLLTVQAMESYHRHLAPRGAIAIHVTNRYLDLKPVVAAMAKARDYHALSISNQRRQGDPSYSSLWIILSREKEFLDAIAEKCSAVPEQTTAELNKSTDRDSIRPWTDDYSNLFRVLYRGVRL